MLQILFLENALFTDRAFIEPHKGRKKMHTDKLEFAHFSDPFFVFYFTHLTAALAFILQTSQVVQNLPLFLPKSSGNKNLQPSNLQGFIEIVGVGAEGR